MTYSLYRTRDHAGDSGGMCLGLVPVYDPEDSTKIIDKTFEDNARPRVGIVLRVGSHYARSYTAQDWWQTTLITEIVREWTDEDGSENVHFKTGNSEYLWKKF